MALELVTGYWGQEHVTADQDADLNAGVIGSDRYVLPIGEKMRAEAVTSNKIRIFDGVFAGYGRQCQIEEGAYVDVEIENGTAGLLRNDMIIVKYAKDETTGIEGVSFGVLKGQTGTTATDPVPNNQDIRTGAFESEMPLYRVKLNGLAIEAIQPLYSVPKTLAELTASLTTLNRNINATLHSEAILSDVLTEIYQLSPYDIRNYERKKITPISVNRPSGLQYGYRDIYIYDTNNVVIEVTEMVPVYGRKHYNYYNGTSTQGWVTK